MTMQRGVFVVLCVLFCAAIIAGCGQKEEKDKQAHEIANLKNQLAEQTKANKLVQTAYKDLETKLDEQKKMYEQEMAKITEEKDYAETRMKEAVISEGEYKTQLTNLKTGLQDQLKQKLDVIADKDKLIQKRDDQIKLLKDVIEELRKSALPEAAPAE